MWIPYALFLLVFQLYLRTHCASFNINDSGETILVCTQLTISHSPGYPLHALWGKLNNILFPFGQPMFRVTLASMWMGAASVSMFYVLLKRVLRETLGKGLADPTVAPLWVGDVAAFAGSLLFAFSYQHWFQAGGAKGGIYTLNTFLTLAILICVLRMAHRGWAPKSLIMVGFLLGLSLSNHWPNLIILVPAYLWLLFTVQNRVEPLALKDEALKPTSLLMFGAFFFISAVAFLTGPVEPNQGNAFVHFIMMIGKAFLIGLGPVSVFLLLQVFEAVDVVRAGGGLMLGLTPYVFLAIRAHQHPVVSWWNPENLVRLWETVIRKGYSNIGDPRSMATLTRNLKRFWLEFHDQFGSLFSYVVFFLAIAGVVWMWQRRRTLALGFGMVAVLLFTGIMIFNNPAEGYQWTLDNFFTPIYMSFAFFAAAGLAALGEFLTMAFTGPSARPVVAAVLLSMGSVTMFLNWQRTDQSRYVSAYDYGQNMLRSVDRNGVILCNGDIDILPLWYFQYVLGKRPEVASLTMQLIPYDWYRDPLFEKYPFLEVPVGPDVRPQTVVQDMIKFHAQERSFYFTNIFTAPWMRDQNPSMPEGFMWRITSTKGMGFPLTTERMNLLWGSYRLRSLDPPDRGYWDEYTDVMKDSYGIGLDFSGYFFHSNHLPVLALWCFENALKYRQPQTWGRIYIMMEDAYLALQNAPAALAASQKALEIEPNNPYGYVRMGQAMLGGGNLEGARQAFQTAQQIAPQLPDAQQGLSLVDALSKGGTFGIRK